MTKTLVPGGWYIDAKPSGEFACLLRDIGVMTHLGLIPIYAAGNNCLYVRVNESGPFSFAGQGHLTDQILEYLHTNVGGFWKEYQEVGWGVSPVIYTKENVLLIASKFIGSQGYRFADYYTGRVFTGDETYGPFNELSEWSYLGNEIYVGQSELGILIWDGLHHRLLDADNGYNIRYRRDGENVAISYWVKDVDPTSPSGYAPSVIIQVTMSELRALPITDDVPSLKVPAVTVLNWNLDELKDGREFNFIDRENEGFGARIWIENRSMFAEFRNPVGVGRTGKYRPVKECPSVLEPVPVLLPLIKVEGKVFKNPDGTIFPYRDASAFLLLRRLLEGDKQGVHEYCKEMSKLGYNVLRVFSQVDWDSLPGPGPGFLPEDYGYNIYNDAVRRLLDIAAACGLYIELVAHTFAYNMNDMANHVHRLNTIVKHHPRFFEVANEPPVNGIDIEALMDLIDTSEFNCPWATGQYDPTALPAGSYVTAHTARDSEWPRKAKWLLEYREGGGPVSDDDPAMNRPIVGDEPIGAGEIDIPGKRATSPDDFYTYAALAQLMGAGSTFHYQDGLFAELPTGNQLLCAVQFIKGAKSVDPNFQLGTYTRVGLSNSPISSDDSLRTYGMILGNKAIMVRVRPNGTFEVADGWRMEAIDSTGIVINLVRE